MYLLCQGYVRKGGKLAKSTTVALSTAEAEYVALGSAAQEAIWLQ